MEKHPVRTSSELTSNTTTSSMIPMALPVTSHVPMTSHPEYVPASLSEAVSPEELDLLLSYIARITCVPVEFITDTSEESKGNIPAIDKLLDDAETEMVPTKSSKSIDTQTGENLTADEFVMQLLSGSGIANRDDSSSASQRQLPLRSAVAVPTSPGSSWHFTSEPERSFSPESSSSEGQCYGAQDSPLSDDGSYCDARMQQGSEGYRFQYQGQGHDTGTTSQEGQPRLWKFVLDLIEDPRYNPSLITWVSREEGIFKLTDPNRLAEFWGQVKGNKSMNYEKFSRGLRYYYTHHVLEHVPGKLVYKFGEGATSVWKYMSETMSPMYARPPFVSQGPSQYGVSPVHENCAQYPSNPAPEVKLEGRHPMFAAPQPAAQRCPNMTQICPVTHPTSDFLVTSSCVTSQEGMSFMSQAMDFEPSLTTTQQMLYQRTPPALSSCYTSPPMHDNLTTSTASTMSSTTFQFPSSHQSPLFSIPFAQSHSSEPSNSVPKTTATVTSHYPPYTTY